MDVATAMIVTGMCAALGLLAIRTAGAGADVVMMMFRSPADLGWPSGVQEDDDLHWRWSGVLPAAGADGGTDGPPLAEQFDQSIDDPRMRMEIVELPSGTGPRPSPVARR